MQEKQKEADEKRKEKRDKSFIPPEEPVHKPKKKQENGEYISYTSIRFPTCSKVYKTYEWLVKYVKTNISQNFFSFL